MANHAATFACQSAGSLPVVTLWQVVNDYDKDVFNGDQGFVREITTTGQSHCMTVAFPPSFASAAAGNGVAERLVEYKGRETDAMDLAWATTVHKAQGGESKAVLLALSPTHRPLLSRRLLYTGKLTLWCHSCLTALNGAAADFVGPDICK